VNRPGRAGPAEKSRPPRIVFLVTALVVGGAEQQARHLARAFRRRGWEVAVISLVRLDAPESVLEAEGIRVETLGMRSGVPDPLALARLVRLLREWRPDVLQSLMVHANLVGRVVRLLVRIPVVVSSIRTPNEGPAWRYLAYRATNRLADATTAVSQDAIDAVTRRGAAPRTGIRLIPNGLDVAEFEHDDVARSRIRRELGIGDAFLWLSVGRLTEAKDYPTLIDAFAAVSRGVDAISLVIAGPGPLEDELRERIGATGLRDRVRLLGERRDIPALLSAADAFVLSSAWEGLPMVLLEAGAARLPVVATRVGANPTVVDDRVTGLLAPPADAAALAAAMTSLMTMDPDARRAMGLAGHRHVARLFDLDAVAETWQALYAELLAERGHPLSTARRDPEDDG